jgi:hypothetical protein
MQQPIIEFAGTAAPCCPHVGRPLSEEQVESCIAEARRRKPYATADFMVFLRGVCEGPMGADSD